MKVTNLTSPRNGAKVAKQYNIEHNGVDYFQSYNTIVARYKPWYLEVNDKYKYSKTTALYFRQWLKRYGLNDNEIDRLKGKLHSSDLNRQFDFILDNSNVIEVFYHKEEYNL